MLDVQPARNVFIATLVQFNHFIYMPMLTQPDSACMAVGCSTFSLFDTLSALDTSLVFRLTPTITVQPIIFERRVG
jgi:hypothetical protein